MAVRERSRLQNQAVIAYVWLIIGQKIKFRLIIFNYFFLIRPTFSCLIQV